MGAQVLKRFAQPAVRLHEAGLALLRQPVLEPVHNWSTRALMIGQAVCGVQLLLLGRVLMLKYLS
jgi:hypothetical protein